MLYITEYSIDGDSLNGKVYDDCTSTSKDIFIKLKDVFTCSDVSLKTESVFALNEMLKVNFYFEFNCASNVFRMSKPSIIMRYLSEPRKNKFLQKILGNKMIINKKFMREIDIIMLKVDHGLPVVAEHLGLQNDYKNLCSHRENFIREVKKAKGVCNE